MDASSLVGSTRKAKSDRHNVLGRSSDLDRGIDLYRRNSAKSRSAWLDGPGTMSTLAVRGRAQVGVHSAKSDWPKRIIDFQYIDYRIRLV